MKLKEINQEAFQINKDFDFNVSQLYFDYGDKEVFDLLKQTMVKNIVYDKIKTIPKDRYYENDYNRFYYNKSEEISQSHYHFYFVLINSLPENEKSILMDLALSQKEKPFVEIMLKNPEVKLTSEQFDTIFYMTNQMSSWCYNLRKALIENKNIPLTEEQINEGVLKWDGGLNLTFAERGDNRITKETIDILINDENEDSCFNDETLVALLKNKNLQLTPEQIEIFLTHDDFRIKAECARNYQLQFTPEQIERGLNDEGFEYDGFDDTYDDYNPSDVVNAFLQNPKIKLPKTEVNSIVRGYNEYANVEAFVQKEDLVLDESQIDAILAKGDRSTALLLTNKSITLNDQQLLTVLYKDKEWAKFVANEYLSRENVTVSEVVLSVLKIHPNEDIQNVVRVRGDSLLDNKIKNKPKM